MPRGGVLHNAQLAVRHKVLRERALFKRLYPRKVGLVVGKYAGHELG